MIRHIRWQIVLALVTVIFVAIALSYQATSLEEITVPATGGELHEGVAGAPQFLNPLFAFDNPVDRDICALVFDGLTRFDEQGKIQPNLAKGWSDSLDGLHYTVWLRDDVYWHDGEPFTADDVLFTLDLVRDPGFTGPVDLANLWRSVEIEKEDDYTVLFHLEEPYSPFISFTTMGILPEHILKNVTPSRLISHSFNRNPVGTGRFQVNESAWGVDTLALSANQDDWRGDIARFSRVVFHFYPDYSTLLTAFEQGEINSIAGVQRADMPRALMMEGLDLYTVGIPRYTAVLMNLQNHELSFQDQVVRSALTQSVSRSQLIADVLNGQGIQAASPIAPNSWAAIEYVQAYDLDTAAISLDEAGWISPENGDGDGMVENEILTSARSKEGNDLAFTLTVVSESVHEIVAEELVKQWALLGVRVTLDRITPGDLPQLLQDGEFEAVMVDIDMTGDPDLYDLWSESAIQEGQNFSGWSDIVASELLEQARQTTNIDSRKDLYRQFQERFIQQVPAILLYYHTYTYGISDQVQQVSIGPMSQPSDRFATVNDWFLVWREVTVKRPEDQ